jgi:hypothetical protein
MSNYFELSEISIHNKINVQLPFASEKIERKVGNHNRLDGNDCIYDEVKDVKGV